MNDLQVGDIVGSVAMRGMRGKVIRITEKRVIVRWDGYPRARVYIAQSLFKICLHLSVRSHDGWVFCLDCGFVVSHPELTEAQIVMAIRETRTFRIWDTVRIRLPRPFMPRTLTFDPEILIEVSQPVMITPELYAKAYGCQ